MSAHQPPNPGRMLALLVALLGVGFALILLPFMGAVLWAVFIAIVFEPLHARVRLQVGSRPTVAALLTLGLIVAMPVIGHASWHAYREVVGPTDRPATLA